MFNKALFKLEWKSNYKLLIIFCLILTIYMTIIISMFDPELGSVLEEFSKAMPEMMAMVGMSGATSTLIDFVSNYLYGFIMIAFPLIFGILLSLKLVVKKVDNGTMSYLLCSGIKRSNVWFTQLLVLISNISVLIVYCTVLGLISSQLMFPDSLDINAFLSLNLGLLLLHLALSGICFMCSCIFNEYRLASLFGAGVPIVFILIQMLSNMEGSMEWLKYATLVTLYDPTKIIAGESSAYLMLGCLALVALICFVVSKIVFDKKSMSL